MTIVIRHVLLVGVHVVQLQSDRKKIVGFETHMRLCDTLECVCLIGTDEASNDENEGADVHDLDVERRQQQEGLIALTIAIVMRLGVLRLCPIICGSVVMHSL